MRNVGGQEMGKIRKVAVIAAALSAALVMAGCGGGGAGSNTESKISVWGGEPQRPRGWREGAAAGGGGSGSGGRPGWADGCGGV